MKPHTLGYPPTVEEYGEWWRESQRTVYREQERFRRAFPGETTPQRLVDHLAKNGADWYRFGVSGAARLDFTLPTSRGLREAKA